ncbi:hypothetical protein BH10ACI2_BH10ACI2_21820 [soil metagenome]
MKNEISFMTGLFESGLAKTASADGRRPGEDLAKWLKGKSMGSEFFFDDPIKSDVGWSEIVTANGESFTLGFGILESTVGSDYAEWHITIEKERKWKFFGAKDSASRGRLCDLVHNILRDEYSIREVQWS